MTKEDRFNHEIVQAFAGMGDTFDRLPADEQDAILLLARRANERLRPASVLASVRNMLPRRASNPPPNAQSLIAENAEWARKVAR